MLNVWSWYPDAIAHTSEGKTVFISEAPSLEIPLVYELPRTQDRFSRTILVKVLKHLRSESLSQSLCIPQVPLLGATLSMNRETQRCDLCSERIGHFLPDDVSELVKILFPGEPWDNQQIELALQRVINAGRDVCA